MLLLGLLAGCASAPRGTATAPASAGRVAIAQPRAPEARDLARAFEARLTVWTRPDGSRVLSRRCRSAPVPCRARLAAFAALIHDAAVRHGLDPFLLGALAMRESGLDPSAIGRRGEAGLIQLHPRGAGRGVRYVEDAAYRAQCQQQLDACQAPVLERGARTLADAIERCGGLVSGLGAYASGRCGRAAEHAERVLRERDRLRALTR